MLVHVAPYMRQVLESKDDIDRCTKWEEVENMHVLSGLGGTEVVLYGQYADSVERSEWIYA
jgi:hypothetical protein